jgi:hypothetical protein
MNIYYLFPVEQGLTVDREILINCTQLNKNWLWTDKHKFLIVPNLTRIDCGQRNIN